ncbi:hypothetical protein BH23VER1_BH23VER1_33080 [soil metagenome]
MTGRTHGLLVAAGILLVPAAAAPAQERSDPPRLFSQRVRELDARIDAIRDVLALLPEPPSGSKGGTLGYHSNLWTDPSSKISATIDLGQQVPIDAVVMVPANVVYGFEEGGGYGFPRGFRVDLSPDEAFATPVAIADFTGTRTFPSPGDSPVVLEAGGVSGRFVRVTATDLWRWPSNDRSLFALGEILVFSGGQNVAPWKGVSASDSRDSEPLWSLGYLVDGQSSLGHATIPERSPSNGYHSEVADTADAAKWVQVDLGEEFPIREIRLVPARPRDFPELQGFGFPEQFVVECSNAASFDGATVLMDWRDVRFPNPGDNAVPIPLPDGVRARYVRCTATHLWKRDNDYVFALGELQVFSGAENVALGAGVTSFDSTEAGLWSEPFLVDGFDSRERLREDQLGWLNGLARRHALERELAALAGERAHRVDRIMLRLTIAAAVGALATVVLLGILIARNRLYRRRETDRLRERIASDLHDEIGSNLGSIALLSEIAPGAQSGELVEINRIARETGDSMRDIVWVIRIGHDSLEDLIARLREVATGMLRNVRYSFEVEPDPLPAVQPDLNFKRNVLLFFKEALHNVVKHASADTVAIRIVVTGQQLWLSVSDDGCGFDPAEASTKGGNGLGNLRTRAEALGASLEIKSSPGAGTLVSLESARFTALRHRLGLTRLRDGRHSPAR